MEKRNLDPRLRLMQAADLQDKVVLLRVDHNVVKKGRIEDPYRIDVTIGTIYAIAEQGGRPVLMTHVGRPRDKQSGKISCKSEQSVLPIVEYLRNKLPLTISAPEFPIDSEKGILHLEGSILPLLDDLKKRKISMIYLPNTRWFQGEQAKGKQREIFAGELAALADLYVNDAFGSWQPHVSTHDAARRLPAYAGMLLQKELAHLDLVLNPERPFVAVIAGAKYDTKIGPLKALYEKVDRLILGGLMYNTYLAAKYDVQIGGVSDDDRKLAGELVEMDAKEGKIVELPRLVESESQDGKIEGQYRNIGIDAIKEGRKFNYLLDAAPQSFDAPPVKDALRSARTIFVNAVMGFMPDFFEGTRALFRMIASNSGCRKLLAGGDTLQELRNLCPELYLEGLDADDTYYFTGGGSVLKAIELGSPYKMQPIEALLKKE